MFTLQIWVFKSGVLKRLFIVSNHGTKANIRSTKIGNNKHAYSRDVLKAIGRQMGYHYTVVSLLVRTHANQQCERLAKIR
jgi:hypothetical protein